MRRFREPMRTGSEPVTDRFRQPVPGGGLYRPPEPVPKVHQNSGRLGELMIAPPSSSGHAVDRATTSRWVPGALRGGVQKFGFSPSSSSDCARYASMRTTIVSGRTPSYAIASRPSSVSIEAMTASRSATSITNPTRVGFCGSTNVRMPSPTARCAPVRPGHLRGQQIQKPRLLIPVVNRAIRCPSFRRCQTPIHA